MRALSDIWFLIKLPFWVAWDMWVESREDDAGIQPAERSEDRLE